MAIDIYIYVALRYLDKSTVLIVFLNDCSDLNDCVNNVTSSSRTAFMDFCPVARTVSSELIGFCF